MVVESNPIILTPGLLVHGPLGTNPWSPLGNLQWCRDPVPPNHVLNTMLAHQILLPSAVAAAGRTAITRRDAGQRASRPVTA